jgi:RNA polymerase sigma-70 factor (ECF subfamily)
MESSDEDLAARCDLASLYDRYARRLLSFLSARGVPDGDLDDVHQDVWIRVHGALSARPFSGHFRGWLFQIARNLVIDRRRKTVPESPLPGDDEFTTTLHDSPAEALTRKEVYDQLSRCLEHLEAREAAVVRGRTGGQSYDEVCAELGIDRNLAYKIYHTATARLADCMRRAGL